MFSFKTLSALSLFTALLVQATPVKLADGSKTVLGRDAADPTQTPGPLEWQYLGCYEDKEGADRIFPLRPTTDIPSDKTSYELCTAACLTDGYYLAGLETGQWYSRFTKMAQTHIPLILGSECWCSNFEKTPQASLKGLPEGSCKSPCTGNTTTTCGGAWAMDIYAFMPHKA